MAYRIEIYTDQNDTRSQKLEEKLRDAGFTVSNVKIADVYTINKTLTEKNTEKVAEMLSNPVTQSFLINDHKQDLDFDFALEIGFLPGVTDNVASTARESIEDLLKDKFETDESVHSSQLIFLKGDLDQEKVEKIGQSMANQLIERIHIKSREKFAEENGMDTVVPKVRLQTDPKVSDVNLEISEEELLKIGKEGILDEDGTRRGPLALDSDYLHAIKNYFQTRENRQPTDIELESLAQTWSEHCKHTIFASPIDDNPEGLYKGYIKKATQDIRNAKGSKDFCVSVFKDNSGGIIFDENWVITDKAETHNTPSALDPFGGSITGIVGVNRDCIGFGKGAKPVINKYGFCVGLPDDDEKIYRDKELTTPALSPKRIFEGVVEGVNVGGNCSGIPTPQGFVYFHENYKGKPLIFVGTVGLIPKEINGKPSYEKKAVKGDKVIMIGGRVGQDGIHGATFSSEALTAGSPSTAVQIGDPITQKKLSDTIIKEARARNLYNSITDNGAGGLSCSVAEMARECGGCEVDLDQVPLKYPNLDPWKIWISESQERMTLAVPPEKVEEFIELMESRGVEATVIGEFTDSGRCQVSYKGEKIMDLDMDFLHDGLPEKHLKTTYQKAQHAEPNFPEPSDYNETLHQILKRPNITGFAFISRQYDHEVQAGSVLKPLQGPGEVNANVSVTRPVFDSPKAVVCSQALHPHYAEVDTYHMAACSIDEAIRNVISAGGSLDHLALMDNFCWCSSNDPYRLGQLKAAAQACYHYSVKFGTPYISGKDSMFNDFQGFNEKGEEIKISAPPTLLISATGVMEDATHAVSLDPKFAGDLVYILGQSKDELGGSEYFDMNGFTGNKIPQVEADQAIALYKKFTLATKNNLISSSLSITRGGILPALAKKAIAAQLGLTIDIQKIPQEGKLRTDYLLFSESQTRFLVTIAPEHQEIFEKHFQDQIFAQIGTITEEKNLSIKSGDSEIIHAPIHELTESYKSTFKNY